MSRGVGFVKMSGSGNDFLVLDAEQRAVVEGNLVDWIRRVCRRGVSVGADGVLFVEPGHTDRVRVAFHNPDGSAAFCGNGSRCAARYARERGMAGDEMVLETIIGDVPARVAGTTVLVTLPAPIDRGALRLAVGEERVSGRFVLAGAPHFVVLGTCFPPHALERMGPVLRRAPEFGPEGVNVDLVETADPSALRVRTWERGVEGETLSCGSGAVAAAFAAALSGWPRSTRVLPRSGIPLTVRFPGDGSAPDAAVLGGDARIVFEGRLAEEATAGFPGVPPLERGAT